MTTTKHKAEDITVGRRYSDKLHAYPASLQRAACGAKRPVGGEFTAAPTCQRCRDWWEANVEGGLLG